MPAGIAMLSFGGKSSGRGTLGLECPVCNHRHDYEDKDTNEGIARVVYDCNQGCGCRSENFIEKITKQP